MTFTDIVQLVEFVTKKAKLPLWQTQLFCKYRDEIQVHSKGLMFYKIDRLFPNEDPASKNTRILSFEPVTRGSFMKGVSNINRIFSNSSYTAEASEKTIQEAKKKVYAGKNLFAYYLENWLRFTLSEDPNSLMVVYPEEYANEKGIPTTAFINSEYICYTDHETFIFKSEYESTVTYELKTPVIINEFFFDATINRSNVVEKKEKSFNQILETKFEKTVYHVFTQNMFHVIRPVEGTTDKFTVETIILKNFTKPPVQFNEACKSGKVNESFLKDFIPFGNLALLQHSQHMAVNFSFSFPRMREIVGPCDYPVCNDGFIECTVSEIFPDGRQPCPICKGTGIKSFQSPFKSYQVKYNPNGIGGDENDKVLDMDPVKFYTPDTGILDYSKNEWKGYLELAEMAIYVQQKVQTGNVQSADSKNIDLDELHAFLITLSKAFFNGLRFVLQCYENYYNNNPVIVNVNEPFSFAILTEAEAFDALNKILISNAPDIIKGNQVENFINKFVSEDSPVRKAYQVLKIVDVLLLKSTNEISTLKGNAIVTAPQWAIHAFAYPVLMQMYAQDPKTFALDVADLVDKLLTELENFKPDESTLQQKAITQFG